MEFYHGSSIMGLKELKPNFDTLNTVKSNVVYYTKDKTLALFYIWNRPYKYATFHINNEGIIEYTENFPNQLYEFYNGVSGCIYVCNNKDNIITKSHVKDVYISSKPIELTKTIFVDNVYNEIKKSRVKSGCNNTINMIC